MTVHHRYAAQPFRISTVALLCVMLGACSTMQKSSTGERSLEPATAPVSETAKTQAPKAQATETQVRASKPTETTATPAQTSTQAEAATGKTAAAPEAGATSIASEDVDSAKRELAEDEARIKKLREEQELANRRMEEEAPKQRVQEAAAASQAPGATATGPAATATGPAAAATAPTATERPASRVAATKADEQIAVFPSNRNVASNSASPPAVQQPLQRSVYFDYDRSAIKDEYDSMLMAHAAYLRSHPNTTTEIQGNCDERGSREYNLALGARRAEAVKRALELAGADGRKIKTVSFGSEKPVALGKDEESYSQNRRADIVN
jgi:peptidoglycan-associated lipoprotein